MSTLVRCARTNMKYIRVYQGVGVYEDDTDILVRVLKKFANEKLYKVECISPEEIVEGKLCKETALLAIGGGYDMGLIKSLGDIGMNKIKTYVQSGGNYLGICSGAYFACGRIEFDKDGPLEVIGDRYLKFFPGCGVGPLFKPYDYRSRKGALAVDLNFVDCKQSGIISQSNTIIAQDRYCCKTYFNGGLYFNEKEDINMDNVTVLSRYLNLLGHPAAIVQCKFGSGTAVLSGPHFEYDTDDIDDGDTDVVDIIQCLKDSASLRKNMMVSVLNSLNILTNNV